MAKLLNAQLPGKGFEVMETIPHPTPTRDFNNIVLRIKAPNPDIVIPANYYNEYVAARAHHAAAEGAAEGDLLGARRRGVVLQVRQGISGCRQCIMDCNHWFDPRNAKALGAEEEGRGARASSSPTRSIMNYSAMLLLADALERAALGRSRQDHRGAGELDLLRPRHAVRADQVRQRPEPGRGAGEHAGASTTTSR